MAQKDKPRRLITKKIVISHPVSELLPCCGISMYVTHLAVPMLWDQHVCHTCCGISMYVTRLAVFLDFLLQVCSQDFYVSPNQIRFLITLKKSVAFCFLCGKQKQNLSLSARYFMTFILKFRFS